MTSRGERSGVDGILARRDQAEASVFLPENLLREARRQLGLPEGRVPAVCPLDPDGDIVRSLRERASRSGTWACYHTDLWETEIAGTRLGTVGSAVGAPFAVLVAEQLFASGCELLVSVTSAGRVAPDLTLPCFILIERALRGEGTSGGYLPAGAWAEADAAVVRASTAGLAAAGIAARRGTTWTTDAPYRETASALAGFGFQFFLALYYLPTNKWSFEQPHEYVPLLIPALVPAGRVWGLDALLTRRNPGLRRWPF